ncbi:DedA family protein [Microbacterium stercoris]|uniref:DedA family protein n=1 Tax=Microbacterium stercoris TaxID=2820289 RepID=A0A939QJS4_9MICO|nr:DedA family protein [Microbacterium stercoris]MBO3662982.1 DedA family protein [Microbacterium stercoris]
MDAITAFLTDAISSPLMPLIVFAACVIDGFFPPVPSETSVVAAGALALTGGGDPATLAAVVLAAAAGAFTGDSLAYLIGRRIGTDRFAWMRRPAVRRALGWAARQLERRPATLILTARYVPIGRVAVNTMAGATRMPYRRFATFSAMAAVSWAVMCLLISALASTWFPHTPLASAATAVVISLLLGVAVDAGMRLVRRLRRRGAPDAAPCPEAPAHEEVPA